MAANGEMASRVPDGVQQICEGLARTLNVVIEDAPDMDAAKQYIRTRHNNIRCFPKCGKVHKTKSFCGTPLTITLQLSNGGSIEPFINQMYIFGEFRNVRKAPAFQVLTSCTPKQREQNAFVPGQLSSANGQASFTINPPRKWRYRARIAQILDMHVFTIYVVFQDVVVAIKDSPQFQVIPIWKADESMLKGDGEMEEEEEEDEVEAGEDAEDGGENPDRLTRQESFSKRMKNNQQQQQQHFSGYQLHHDGSSSLHGSSPRQNASSATGSIVGLPFFSTQTIPSLRLGALPNQASSSDPNGSPKSPSMIASSSHATLNRTSSGSLFPPPMTQQPPRPPSPSLLGSNTFMPNQYFPNPLMAPQSGFGNPTHNSGTGLPSFFPGSSASGMMHMGPEAFSHMHLNSMGTYGSDLASAMHQPMVTATSQQVGNGSSSSAGGSSSQANGSSSAGQTVKENKFLSNLLSNAYVTGQAINNVISQTAQNSQQQQQYYNSLGMSPPTSVAMAAAYSNSINSGAPGQFHPTPGSSTFMGFSSMGQQQQQQGFPFTASAPTQQQQQAPVSSSTQQAPFSTTGGSSSSSSAPQAPQPRLSGMTGLSNSKNVKDKHQD